MGAGRTDVCQAQFEKVGAELQFTDGAIQEVARIGLKRGGGARGLRGILEEVLLDAMYDAPGSVSPHLSHMTRGLPDDWRGR